MRIPLSWLREHCPTDLDVDELADRLSRQGVHVEGVDLKASAMLPAAVTHRERRWPSHTRPTR